MIWPNLYQTWVSRVSSLWGRQQRTPLISGPFLGVRLHRAFAMCLVDLEPAKPTSDKSGIASICQLWVFLGIGTC